MTTVPKPDIVAEVTLLPRSEGGRQSATPADWYGCPLGFEGEYFDVRFDLSSVGRVAPGATVRVPGWFLSPELIKPRLSVASSHSGRAELWARVASSAIHQDT